MPDGIPDTVQLSTHISAAPLLPACPPATSGLWCPLHVEYRAFWLVFGAAVAWPSPEPCLHPTGERGLCDRSLRGPRQQWDCANTLPGRR